MATLANVVVLLVLVPASHVPRPTRRKSLAPRRQNAIAVVTLANAVVLLVLVAALPARKPRLRRLPVPTRRLATAAETRRIAHARLESVLAADARSRLVSIFLFHFVFHLGLLAGDGKLLFEIVFADFWLAPVFYPASSTPSSAQAQDTIVDSAKVAPLDPVTEKSA